VGLNQAGRRIASSLSIASEGVQAAYIANQVNKAQKKHLKDEDSTSDTKLSGNKSESNDKKDERFVNSPIHFSYLSCVTFLQ
jgi:hypothetical protein